MGKEPEGLTGTGQRGTSASRLDRDLDPGRAGPGKSTAKAAKSAVSGSVALRFNGSSNCA